MTTLFPPHPGGIETWVQALTTGLGRTGEHRCTVVTRQTGGLPGAEDLDGVGIRRVGGPRGGLLVERLRFLYQGWRHLRRGVGQIDVIHAHSLYIPALLAALCPVPGVATLHTTGPTGNLQDLQESGVGRLRLGLYRKRLRRVIALTRTMAATLEAAGFLPERIAVIPNGVDPERFSPVDEAGKAAARIGLDLPRRGPLVAFLGRLVREKGADVLLEAWPEIQHRAPGAHLVVAGRGEEGESLRREAETRGLTRAVHWIPDLEDSSDVYRAADVLVVPSRAESFGLVALEGMASGVPVVASRVGGVPEVVGEAAVLVEAEEPGDLARGVAALLNDPAHRRHLSAAGRRRVLQRFTLERAVGLHRDLYRGVLAESS